MPSWRIVSEIYESVEYPIVVHIFYGQSTEEAAGYYRAHMQTDTFLAGCVERGSFQGKFACREQHRLERFYPPTGQWVAVA